MSHLRSFSFIAVLVLLGFACSSHPDRKWTRIVPQNTSFVIIPSDTTTLQSVLKSSYIPLIDDISSSAVQLITKIDSAETASLPLKSIILYPGTEQKLQPIWVTAVPSHFKEYFEKKYAQDFTQNKYFFHGTTIYIARIAQRKIFTAQLGSLLLMSESSLGIEHAVRTYDGVAPPVDLSDINPVPGSIIINTPSLDTWVAQLTKVIYGPSLKGTFKGTKPALLTFSTNEKEKGNKLKFSGTIPLADTDPSLLVSSLSYKNVNVTLDQYISSNAAAFGIFNFAPNKEAPESLVDTTETDAFLLQNSDQIGDLAMPLDNELGLVMYAESGFLSKGEYLFERKLNDPAALRKILNSLSGSGHLKAVDDTYFVQSRILGRLFGSPLCNFKDFYVRIVDDALVITKRKGLTQIVASDHSQRRVVSYEPFYKDIQRSVPDKLSGLFVVGPEFSSFLNPFLDNDNYVEAFTSSFDYLALALQKDESGNNLKLSAATFKSKNTHKPYQENWLYNTGGVELSGKPVFGNIGGSLNDEVVFATKTGSIYVIANDGTIVQQFNTGSDVPVGSPLVYDWYGTGQNVILVAAGDKIYGWDEHGDMLPKFPFRVGEQITTSLTLADVNHNGLPNAIVGTADRYLHVLNGRGTEMQGWPVRTNTTIRSAPLIDYYHGVFSVMAFSANTLHAWNATGNPLTNFPVFINATFTGSPVLVGDNILGGAANGYLYSIGQERLFSDSLNVYHRNQSNLAVQAVYVSNNPISGTPYYGNEMLLAGSANGSVFLMKKNGQLQLTKNMGQSAATNWSPLISDINNDGSPDIIDLASFGRLYAWQIKDGARLFDLPATGMSNVAIGDLDGDGLKEIVAQTKEGVQCWTINKKQ